MINWRVILVALACASGACGNHDAQNAPPSRQADPSAIATPADMVRVRGRFDGAMFVDKTEVTVAGYRDCVDAGRCTAPSAGASCPDAQLDWGKADRDRYPINCVTPQQAVAYCAFRDKRLPDDLELKAAVDGGWSEIPGIRFPWGDEPADCTRAVITDDIYPPGCEHHAPEPAGSRPAGVSPIGALDLVGNVAELAVLHDYDTAGHDPIRQHTQISVSTDYVLVGGAFDTRLGSHEEIYFDLGSPAAYPPDDGDMAEVGFRCVLTVPTPKAGGVSHVEAS